MSKINKLTTSFHQNYERVGRGEDQDEYTIYVSMLDEEELECLKYVQRLRKYTNRQSLASSTSMDTDESNPEKKKRGRKNKVTDDDAIMSDPITPDEPTLPPSPA